MSDGRCAPRPAGPDKCSFLHTCTRVCSAVTHGSVSQLAREKGLAQGRKDLQGLHARIVDQTAPEPTQAFYDNGAQHDSDGGNSAIVAAVSACASRREMYVCMVGKTHSSMISWLGEARRSMASRATWTNEVIMMTEKTSTPSGSSLRRPTG